MSGDDPLPIVEPGHRLWRMPIAAPDAVADATGRLLLRVPTEGDVDILAGYAPSSGEHGIWLPVGRLDLPATVWAAWFVRELRLGWTAFGGRYGGGLLADFDGHPAAAYLNFVPLEPGVVELAYGVAPHLRGRGIASRSADLAASWALSIGFQRVELHISSDHAESRRVAENASFTFAREVKKHVAATGHDYEDVIYVREA